MMLRRFKVVLQRLPFPQTTTQGDPGRTWAWGRPHASACFVAALWPGVASHIGLGRHGKGTGCKSRAAGAVPVQTSRVAQPEAPRARQPAGGGRSPGDLGSAHSALYESVGKRYKGVGLRCRPD